MDVNIDTIFTGIGLGKWQMISILTTFLTIASYPTMFTACVFTNMPVNHRCRPHSNELIHEKNKTKHMYDNSCEINSTLHTELMNRSLSNSEKSNTMEPCDIFEYDTSVFESTFTTEFNLVCGNGWISSLYQKMSLVGVIIGCTITGISERLGRTSVIRIGTFFYLACALGVAYAPQLPVILAARFFLGICYELVLTSSFTLMMEIVPPGNRSFIGMMVSNLANTSCIILTGIVSYLVRKWRTLHLILSFPIYIMCLTVIFLPRSPRWLIQNGYNAEAIVIFQEAAKTNKGSLLPDNKIYSIIDSIHCSLKKDKNKSVNSYGFLQSIRNIFYNICTNSGMKSISLFYPLVWFFTSIVYFFIPLNANNFTTNPFLYIVIAGITYIPPTIFGPLLIKKYGNIRTTVVMYILTMFSMLSLMSVDNSLLWLRWMLVIMSILMISVNYMVIYVMGPELFPTTIRNVSSGIGDLAKHLGILVAIFLTEKTAQELWWLPNLVGILCCLLVVVIISHLPETSGIPYSETIADVEYNYKNYVCKKYGISRSRTESVMDGVIERMEGVIIEE